MAQLHCYLPDEEAESLRHRAQRAGMSVSRYLAELARKDLISNWPEGYFDRVFGGGDIAPIARDAEGEFEKRAPIK